MKGVYKNFAARLSLPEDLIFVWEFIDFVTFSRYKISSRKLSLEMTKLFIWDFLSVGSFPEKFSNGSFERLSLLHKAFH